MRSFISVLVAVIPAFITGIQAWSTDVHQQIGYMAEEFLSAKTNSVLQEILEPEYEGSLGRAAAWADSFAHTDEGAYSYQWHWIDSSDNPPAFCNLYYNRDCTSGGCIVQAIANQTVKLAECVESVKSGDLRDGSDIECSNALKWVVHFIGDIAQPLHTSGLGVGGNDFDVVYGGESTNLHSVWDGLIIQTAGNVTEFNNQTLAPFFHSLVSRTKDDTFPVPTDDWTACTDPSTPVACALDWARDSNVWNCDFVYSQIFNNTDLLTSGYATGGIPIVELQASKAALRLGTWLNQVVWGHYNQDRQVILDNYPSWADGSTGGI